MVPVLWLGVCLCVTLLIVDRRHYSECCIRSAVTRCTVLVVLYLGRMCQFGLHAAHCSHIGILLRLPLQYLRTFISLSVSLCNDLADPVFDGVRPLPVSRAGPMLFYCLKLLSIPTIVFYCFSFYRSVYWLDCGADVFWLIGCTSLSLSHALTTTLNDNNNSNKYCILILHYSENKFWI